MQNNDRKPEIRFSGFEAGWKKKCFGDEFDILSNNTFSRDFLNYDQGIAKNVHYGDVLIKFNEYLDASKEVLPYIEDEKVIDKFKNSFLRDGDIVIADTAEDETVGKCTEIGKISDLPIIAGLHTMPCRPKAKYAPMYLGYYLNANAYHRELLPLMQGVKVTSISRSGVKDTDIIVSEEYDEQKKIGQFLFTLDEKIKFEQDKLGRLIILKKSMLEKMFPQGNSMVPEIRFGKYTGEWEQRNVTDVGKIFIGLVTTMTKHYTNEGYILIRNSDIKDGRFEFGNNPIYLDKDFAEENSSRMHQVGDVITVHTGDVGTSAVVEKNEVNSIGFATIVTRPYKDIIDSNYLSTFLNTDTHKKWAVAISTGDGRTNYNLGDYIELMVPVPELEEQKKVANFISKLNNLITLHKRKVDKLKNIKSSCMDKMFV